MGVAVNAGKPLAGRDLDHRPVLLQQGRYAVLLQRRGVALRAVVRGETHLHSIAWFDLQSARHERDGCDAAVDQRLGKSHVGPDRTARFGQRYAALDVDARALLDVYPFDDARMHAAVQFGHARVTLHQDERGRQREQAENALHTDSPMSREIEATATT